MDPQSEVRKLIGHLTIENIGLNAQCVELQLQVQRLAAELETRPPKGQERKLVIREDDTNTTVDVADSSEAEREKINAQ